jgi:hypothetical protein
MEGTSGTEGSPGWYLTPIGARTTLVPMSSPTSPSHEPDDGSSEGGEPRGDGDEGATITASFDPSSWRMLRELAASEGVD